jgi:hypothetical protein
MDLSGNGYVPIVGTSGNRFQLSWKAENFMILRLTISELLKSATEASEDIENNCEMWEWWMCWKPGPLERLILPGLTLTLVS